LVAAIVCGTPGIDVAGSSCRRDPKRAGLPGQRESHHDLDTQTVGMTTPLRCQLFDTACDPEVLRSWREEVAGLGHREVAY